MNKYILIGICLLTGCGSNNNDIIINQWENDLNNLIVVGYRVYYSKYWGGSVEYDPRIEISDKELKLWKKCRYIVEQDKYYCNK